MPTWIVRWTDDRGKRESFSSTSEDKVRDVVLDLLRRELEFRVMVTRPREGRSTAD